MRSQVTTNLKRGTKVNGSTSDSIKHDVYIPDHDTIISSGISSFMKGYMDLREAESDPDLNEIDQHVRHILDQRRTEKLSDDKNREFVKKNINLKSSRFSEEIRDTFRQVNDRNLDEITLEWVKDWHNRRQNRVDDSAEKANREFVMNSLQEKAVEEEVPVIRPVKAKMMIFRFSGAAAAVIVMAMMLRFFSADYSTDKLISSYFVPYKAVPTITRGDFANDDYLLNNAIGSYKAGDYKAARETVANIIDSGNASVPVFFIAGILEYHLSNFNIATQHLLPIAESKSDYTKEALWYLGFTYLETGETQLAKRCFEILSADNGFYSKNSQKILRRLK